MLYFDIIPYDLYRKLISEEYSPLFQIYLWLLDHITKYRFGLFEVPDQNNADKLNTLLRLHGLKTTAVSRKGFIVIDENILFPMISDKACTIGPNRIDLTINIYDKITIDVIRDLLIFLCKEGRIDYDILAMVSGIADEASHRDVVLQEITRLFKAYALPYHIVFMHDYKIIISSLAK